MNKGLVLTRKVGEKLLIEVGNKTIAVMLDHIDNITQARIRIIADDDVIINRFETMHQRVEAIKLEEDRHYYTIYYKSDVGMTKKIYDRVNRHDGKRIIEQFSNLYVRFGRRDEMYAYRVSFKVGLLK